MGLRARNPITLAGQRVRVGVSRGFHVKYTIVIEYETE